MSELSILFCMSISEGDAHVPSHAMTCEVCGVGVWVSASMYELVLTGEVVPHCSGCASAIADLYPLESVFAIHPSQRNQLEGLGLSPTAERYVARMNAFRRG